MPPECGFSGTPSKRGMTWKCRWKTVWPEAGSLNCMIVTPSAPNAAFTAIATFWTIAMSGPSCAGSASSRLREPAFGMTSV